MQKFPISPREMICSFWRNRGLMMALTKREVIGRYRGSFVGILWSFINPIFMLLVFTFVFSVVFEARWNSGGESKAEFALVLFAGLLVFNIFAECLSRAPGLILANSNYVKKVIFPLDILPWVVLGASLFHALVSLLVWLLVYVICYGAPQLTVIYAPLVIAPLLLLVMGVCWGVAALGVYMRDVTQFIGILITALMFVSPIFYPSTALPEEYRAYLIFNPLALIIEELRQVLYWGQPPDFVLLSVYGLIAALIAFGGFALFQKARVGFADVL